MLKYTKRNTQKFKFSKIIQYKNFIIRKLLKKQRKIKYKGSSFECVVIFLFQKTLQLINYKNKLYITRKKHAISVPLYGIPFFW